MHSLRIHVQDIILDGLYLNCARLVREYFEKNFKIDLKTNKINEIGLKTVVQLLADRDLRGAEILLNHMVNLKTCLFVLLLKRETYFYFAL